MSDVRDVVNDLPVEIVVAGEVLFSAGLDLRTVGRHGEALDRTVTKHNSSSSSNDTNEKSRCI